MLERFKWPGLAAVLGILGAVLRRWQLATAFEETLGLDRPGAPASLALTAFFVLAAALLFLFARGTPCRLKADGRISTWDYVFAAEQDSVYLTLMVLAGLFTVLAAPLLLRDAMALVAARRATGVGETGLFQEILALTAAASGVSMVSAGRSARQMRGRGRESAVLLLPILNGCVWVLEAYRANAPDPVLWNYVPLMFAVGAGMLFFLSCAGLSFEAGHPRRMLWLAGMTVVFSAVALAGAPGMSMSALLAGQLAAALAALWAAPANMKEPPADDRFGLRARLRMGLPLNEENDESPEEDASDASQEIQEEDTNG